MNKPSLTFLSKDSGFGDNNNSAYVEYNNNLYLIDCGFAIFSKVKDKFDFKKYNSIYIIITHLHNDHAGTLSQLILYLYFIKSIKPFVLSVCKNMQKYLEITGTPLESYTLLNSLENLEFIETTHTQYLDSFGFCLNLDNLDILYTGDTNTLKPFEKYFDTCNELYIDVSTTGGAHIKIDDVLQQLLDLKEKGILVNLMHIDDIEYMKKITNNEFII